MIEFRPMTDEEFAAYRALFIDHYASLLADSQGMYRKL